MYKIGLTGGIATGKSTVATYLKQKGIPIIDCDILARQAVSIGKPAYNEVYDAFGKEILLDNREIDRAKLGSIVFNNENSRKVLEKIIHKQVIADVNEELLAYNNTKSIVVIDIPLLFEAKLEYLVDEIWVVYCTPVQQIERLMARNNFNKQQALARVNSQMSLEIKIDLADVAINNSGKLEALYQQVDSRLKSLMQNGEIS